MTNQIAMTEKETIVFGAFVNLIEADTAEEQKASDEAISAVFDELNSWIDEMEPKSIRPILTSLVNKGALRLDEEDSWSLTDDGIDFAFAAWIDAKKEAEPAAPVEAPKADADDLVRQGIEALNEALAQEGATKCSALRAVAAAAGNTPRAIFIKAAESVGINRGTAARQWQEARADSPKAEEKTQELIDAAAASFAEMDKDEILARLLPLLSRKDLTSLVE